MDETYKLHAIFSGNVQGVFFRQAVKDHAGRLAISGYVKNLHNNTVEMIAIGTLKALEKLILEIKKRPGAGSISDIQTYFSKTNEKYSGFTIKY